LASGEPAVLDSYQPADTASDKDEALAFRVQQVIESMINPGVAAHGGYVTLLGVRSEIAYIRMGGGCQGCGAADVTLKQGIVTTIKAHVPEIQEVLDSTDHAAGENPFFRDAP
jgi:Fe/S biogenesis protein NfuA